MAIEELSQAAFERANAAGQADSGPVAVEAVYDAERNRIVVRLSSGLELVFAPHDVEGLETASAEALDLVEISASGLGLHWPRVDVDLYLPALLDGVLGSRKWMAARLGRAGGAAVGGAKAEAARENGKRGGRPRKIAAT